MRTRGRLLATLIVVAGLVAAPSIAGAATTGSYSDEVGPNTPTGTATRAAVTALSNNWRAEVQAAGGFAEDPVRFLAPAYTLGQTITGIVHTAADGTTLAMHRTRYSTAATPAFAGNSTSLATAACAGEPDEGGLVLQGDAPRPDTLADTSGCTGSGGFFYNEIGGTGESTTRDAVEFTFGRPVLAFGAWFGDLETRVVGGGVPALLRLYDEAGDLLSERAITPTATTCDSVTAACGNDTTRWLGFVADPTEPVSRMVVIVGDEDVAGTAVSEGFSVIGPTLATFPEVGLAKRVVSVTDNLDGTQDVAYEFRAENTGDVALATVALVDDLDAVYGSQLVGVGAVVVDPASGLTANPGFDGVADTTLATGTLAIGGSAIVTVTVTVLPASAGPFENSATISAVSPHGDTVTDVSQNGTIPDADGDADPGTDSVATPASFVLTGSVTVTSTVASGPTGGATGDLSIEIACLTRTTTLVVALGGSATATGIPVGEDCTVSQVLRAAPPAGYVWTATTGSGAVVRLSTSGENSAVSIGNTLRVLQGDLALSLSITGAPAGGVTADIDYDIDCGAAFSATRTLSLVGATSGSIMVTGIPDGASCTVTEVAPPTAPAFHAWDAAAIDPVPVAIVDGETALVSATRSLREMTGAVQVDWSATGLAAGGLTDDVELLLACGAAGDHPASITLTAASSGSTTVSGIPAPASCVVTVVSGPTAPAYSVFEGPTISTSPAAVADGSTTVVTIADALRATSGIAAMSASIAGAPAGGLTGDLRVRLNCGPAGTFEATLVFTGSSTASLNLSGIPAPSTCTISPLSRPDAPEGYRWAGDLDGGDPITVTDGGTGNVTITGALERVLGTLAVTITVLDAPPAGFTGTFVLEVDCGASGTFPLLVTFGGTTVATGSLSTIPTPADCEVTESSRPVSPPNYRWTTVPLAPMSATVTASPTALSASTSLSFQLPTLPEPAPVTPTGTGTGTGTTGALPNTGVDQTTPLGLAAALLVIGALLLAVPRRLAGGH